MKTTLILVSLYSKSLDADRMEAIAGHYTTQTHDSRQKATYSITDGVATITAFEKVLGQINLPVPFTVPVKDLGSGTLTEITVEVDSLKAHTAICRTTDWANRRQQQRAIAPIESAVQMLYPDYTGLH